MIDDKVRKVEEEFERAESRRVSLFTILAILVVLVGSFALLKSYGVVGRAISVSDNLKCAAGPGGGTIGVLPVNVLGFTIGEESVQAKKNFCAAGADTVSSLGQPLNLLLLGDSCISSGGEPANAALNSLSGALAAGNLGALRNLQQLNAPAKKIVGAACAVGSECASNRCVNKLCAAPLAALPGFGGNAGAAAAAKRAQAPLQQQQALPPNPLAGLKVSAGLPGNQPAAPVAPGQPAQRQPGVPGLGGLGAQAQALAQRAAEQPAASPPVPAPAVPSPQQQPAQTADGQITFSSQGKTTTFPRSCVDDNFVVVEQSNLLAYGTCEGNNARIVTVDCACSQGACVQPGASAPAGAGAADVVSAPVPGRLNGECLEGLCNPPLVCEPVVKGDVNDPGRCVSRGTELIAKSGANEPCVRNAECFADLVCTATAAQPNGVCQARGQAAGAPAPAGGGAAAGAPAIGDQIPRPDVNILGQQPQQQLAGGVGGLGGAGAGQVQIPPPPIDDVVQPGGGIVAGGAANGVLKEHDLCPDGNCPAGFVCRKRISQQTKNFYGEKKCEKPRTAGQSCEEGACGVGLSCTNGKCAVSAGFGGVAGGVNAAARGFAGNVNAALDNARAGLAAPAPVPPAPALLSFDAPCERDEQCVTGACIGNRQRKCKTKGGNSAVCDSNPDCSDNNCIQNVCGGPVNQPVLNCVDEDVGQGGVDKQALVKSKVTLGPRESYDDACNSDPQKLNFVQERVCVNNQVSLQEYNCALANKVCTQGACVVAGGAAASPPVPPPEPTTPIARNLVLGSKVSSTVSSVVVQKIQFAPVFSNNQGDLIFILKANGLKDKNNVDIKAGKFRSYLIGLSINNQPSYWFRLNDLVNAENQDAIIPIAVPKSKFQSGGEAVVYILSGKNLDISSEAEKYDTFTVKELSVKGATLGPIPSNGGATPELRARPIVSPHDLSQQQQDPIAFNAEKMVKDVIGNNAAGGGAKQGQTVICTELYRQGLMSYELKKASSDYSTAYLDAATMNGYHYWAKPLVRVMQRSPKVTMLVAPLGLAWGRHMAFAMGASKKDDAVGKAIADIGVPSSKQLGVLLDKNSITSEVSEATMEALANKYLTGLFDGSEQEVVAKLQKRMPLFFAEIEKYAQSKSSSSK